MVRPTLPRSVQLLTAPVSTSLPVPIQVGNHEFYGGTNLTRYLDSTWEKWEPIATEDKEDKEDREDEEPEERWGGEAGLGGYSTATSALGAFLSAGNHHGPGVHATVPSRSSRFFSVDFGLVHFVYRKTLSLLHVSRQAV